MVYTHRVHNFSAGPSILPVPVLEQAARDLVCHPELGASVMEISHRSAFWVETMRTIEADLRALIGLSDDYAVLFTTGGATMQFAATPLNLAAPGDVIDFIHTGRWSDKAMDEATKLGRVPRIAAESASTDFDRVPTALDLHDDSAYVHYTSNNTIYGTEFHHIPDVGDRLLVCDASSDIFSRPMDISRMGVVYAGAQKNLGPAGVTLVLVRRDLLDRIAWPVPTLMAWKTLADKGSMHNTPPVWPIYIIGLVLKWLKAQGGLEAMDARNDAKAQAVYGALDDCDLFRPLVQPGSRSRMNVTFTLATDALVDAFVAQAHEAGLHALRGHRSAGGCRASLYNALPQASADALADFIRAFQAKHG